jgi:hypothetical protein
MPESELRVDQDSKRRRMTGFRPFRPLLEWQIGPLKRKHNPGADSVCHRRQDFLGPIIERRWSANASVGEFVPHCRSDIPDHQNGAGWGSIRRTGNIVVVLWREAAVQAETDGIQGLGDVVNQHGGRLRGIECVGQSTKLSLLRELQEITVTAATQLPVRVVAGSC